MSIVSALHEWLNTELSVTINFNVVRPDDEDPWYSMIVSESTDEKQLLCDSEGGVLTVDINGYGSQRYNTYEEMEQMRRFVAENLRGNLPGFTVWNVTTAGTVSLGTIDNQINEYSFTIIVSWGA